MAMKYMLDGEERSNEARCTCGRNPTARKFELFADKLYLYVTCFWDYRYKEMLANKVFGE